MFRKNFVVYGSTIKVHTASNRLFDIQYAVTQVNCPFAFSKSIPLCQLTISICYLRVRQKGYKGWVCFDKLFSAEKSDISHSAHEKIISSLPYLNGISDDNNRPVWKWMFRFFLYIATFHVYCLTSILFIAAFKTVKTIHTHCCVIVLNYTVLYNHHLVCLKTAVQM